MTILFHLKCTHHNLRDRLSYSSGLGGARWTKRSYLSVLIYAKIQWKIRIQFYLQFKKCIKYIAKSIKKSIKNRFKHYFISKSIHTFSILYNAYIYVCVCKWFLTYWLKFNHFKSSIIYILKKSNSKEWI